MFKNGAILPSRPAWGGEKETVGAGAVQVLLLAWEPEFGGVFDFEKETEAGRPDSHVLQAALCRHCLTCVVLTSYLQQHGIPVPVTPKNPWSMDENLMHIR